MSNLQVEHQGGSMTPKGPSAQPRGNGRNNRLPSHSRFSSLPQINVPAVGAKKEAKSVKGRKDQDALRGQNTSDWSSNFILAAPKDFVKSNIYKTLTREGSPKAIGGYKAPDLVAIEKRRLQVERAKIHNIIGNNPFKVKNYVQGDDLDNDLVPLKLLKPKRLTFATEEEFIEHFLAEKLKQEAEERTSESKINSKLTTKGP